MRPRAWRLESRLAHAAGGEEKEGEDRVWSAGALPETSPRYNALACELSKEKNHRATPPSTASDAS